MAEAWYRKHIRELEKKLRKLLGDLNGEKKKREQAEKEKKELEAENKKLRDELEKMAMAKASKRPKFPDYSLSKREKLKSNDQPKKSTGRIRFAEKLKTVEFTENVYPEGVPPDKCALISQRIVTRLKDGKKQVWLYRIYRQKWGVKQGKLPEVLGKSEYGIEVAVIFAFLVYVLKLSQDQSRMVLNFFCGLEIEKSQAESLLNQLGKSWEQEFDTLADLIVLAMLVHIDETGWRIGKENCYTWIFRSLTHTLLLFGEKRDESVLNRILPGNVFKGIGITDCYITYEKRFSAAQKCWAHFLRKIIRLMLLYPQKQEYSDFFEQLYGIFQEGKKLKEQSGDKEEGITNLEEKITKICTEFEKKLSKDTEKDVREYVNLQKNLMRNLKDLFTFVRIREVEPTNNEAERNLRHVAKSRNNYQTSKTKKGAKRQSIITSVLFSLKQNLKEFTFKSVTGEVIRWQVEGKSLFRKQLELQCGSPPP
jgi:regulator of replication initiation timing